MSQLALPLKLADHAVFETFFGAGNEALLAFVHDTLTTGKGPGCWIWGAPSTGKSHLLQAVCERAAPDAAFLPVRELLAAGPGSLEGMARRAFLCIDDVQDVAGDAEWEQALFRFYNEARDLGHALFVAARAPARDSGFGLPDLESRFTQLAAFQIHPLGDSDRESALKLRARHRGFDLPDETAHYLLTRQRRDMGSLYALLDRLDSEALAAQRRLTVPFVKSVIGNGGAR